MIALYLYALIVSGLAVLWSLNALEYTVLVWILPTAFLLYKLKGYRLKYLLSGLMWSIPWSIFVDYLGHYSKTWSYWTNPRFASSGLYIHEMPIESYIWGISFWLFYVCVYANYFDSSKTHKTNRLEKFGGFGVSLLAACAIVYYSQNLQHEISYFYVYLLMLSILGTYLMLRQKPNLDKKILHYALAIFGLGLIVETTSMYLKHWTFEQGQYLYTFLLFGETVPIEEFLWWIVVPIFVVATHETFTDNHT